MQKTEVGTTYYEFDHKNNFTLLFTAPKKSKKVVFLSSMHYANSMHKTIRKEDIKCLLH